MDVWQTWAVLSADQVAIIIIVYVNKRERSAADGRVRVVVRLSRTMTSASKGCVAPIHCDGVPTEAGQESTDL